MDGPVRPRPKKESTILGNLVVQVTDVKHEKIFNAQRDKKTKMYFIVNMELDSYRKESTWCDLEKGCKPVLFVHGMEISQLHGWEQTFETLAWQRRLTCPTLLSLYFDRTNSTKL